jgi:carbonic anhydrase/acetyltransferase-like protein (isoleucine patch superfamily)
MAIISPYKNKMPKIASDAFIAQNAVIIGDVEIGSKSSVWYNCVIRGDVNYIRIGDETNIQDGTIIHVGTNNGPTIIGSGVTIGHKALIHACKIYDNSFIE